MVIKATNLRQLQSNGIKESSTAKLNIRQIHDAYSRLAPLYGIWEWVAEGSAQRTAIEMAAIQNGESLLEVAVGLGTSLNILRKQNPNGKNIGMDLTSAMLQRTRKYLMSDQQLDPDLCRGDARFMPFADASFDLVYCAFLLDLLSISDIHASIREMRRVLRPSGRIVILHLSMNLRLFNWFWIPLYSSIPMLLGGCRPIQLTNCLPRDGFMVKNVKFVSQWGIPSEAILATPNV